MRPWLSAISLALAATAAAQPSFSHPGRIRYDSHCFTIDGKDLVLFSGAFHYFRCPKELWRQRFQKIKTAGFNAVETYVAWNWSEQGKPASTSDFSHVRLEDLDEFLKMAEDEFGLYTIVRPGPYICAEWATGGYPNWLAAFKPEHPKRSMWFRSDDPVFEQWSHHWYDAVAKVVVKHQLTRKPVGSHGVILWQVENEYGDDKPNDDMKRNYVKDLMERSIRDGIEVPIFTCWTSCVRDPRGDPILKQAFDNPNEYPRLNIGEAVSGIRDQHRAEPWAPKMITEFQGGWFGQVGGLAASEQAGIDDSQENALTLWSMAHGLTGLNYYMLFGGTNFGDWGGEGITTSYDYFAPLREWGGVGPKYRAVQAIGKMLAVYGPDLARSDESAPEETVAGTVQKLVRKGPSGASYCFYWNSSKTEAADIDPGNGTNLHLPPFGSNLFRYTASPSDGVWACAPDVTSKTTLPQPVRLQSCEVSALTPVGWKHAPSSPTGLRLGIYDSRFISFRTEAPKGKALWIKTAESELIPDTLPTPKSVRQGSLWSGDGRDHSFTLLNPGWPNGGTGMEKPHGIVDALLFEKLPESNAIGEWKMKMLSDQKDRSGTQADVDTGDWVAGVHNDLFLPHTTGVLRGELNLEENPSPAASLSCGGVDDEGWFYVNGHLVGEVHTYDEPVSFPVAQYLHKGKNSVAIVIQNNDGSGGLTGEVELSQPMEHATHATLQWTDSFREAKPVTWAMDTVGKLEENEHPKISGPRPTNADRLCRSTLHFDCPDKKNAWEIVLEAGGDGFLTFNGHALGRYWEVGPQRGFYLPECWMKAKNTVTLTVAPGRLGDHVKAAELRALPWVE